MRAPSGEARRREGRQEVARPPCAGQPGAAAITIDRTDLRIEHASPLSVLKPYWKRPAWFAGEPSIHGKYARLVEFAGPEPEGCARASNPACADVFRRVLGLESVLRAEGIFLYE